jgi:hypothetical protein
MSESVSYCAHAVSVEGYGIREVIVRGSEDREIARAPYAEDTDSVLSALGWRRVGPWDTTAYGAVATVVRITD